MYREEKGYRSYDSDHLTHGSMLKMEHSIYPIDEPDISELISMPRKTIKAMQNKSIKAEEKAFKNIKAAFKEWEKCAIDTQIYDRALAYLKIPETEHTSNKWVNGKDEYDYSKISNKVYQMSYRIYERSSWRTDAKKYDANWFIYTNSPKERYNVRVAGQLRTCNSKEEAEKYIQGRINAYSHLFTEISPTVPKEYANAFMLHGQPLRGYTIEGMEQVNDAAKSEKAEKKPSIRQQLKQSAEKATVKSSPVKNHSKDGQEL